MRLIDADALWEIFREKQNSLTARCGGYRFLDDEDRAEYDRLEITLAYIENAPEVDAVPVVRGEWKNVYRSGHKPNPENVCSECDCWSHRRSDYCPNCGAKMEVEP
jgi:hypothetical protein